ncbi:MAG: sulfotransferase family protein [Pseudomonadota bacterium]
MALKLIGAGLGRTGTASLKVALEELGHGRCYHMSEVLQNPASTQDWIDAANGNADWEKIFSGYTATVDNPGCGFWRQLADYYPDAKVILTIRDANKWFESTNETIHSLQFANFIKDSPWGEMVQKTVYDTMENRMQDRDFMVSFFNNRSEEIIQTIASDRLLVYRVKEGWEPLCKFLDLPVPSIEFPWVNTRDETKDIIAKMTSSSSGQLNEEAMATAGKELHQDNSG